MSTPTRKRTPRAVTERSPTPGQLLTEIARLREELERLRSQSPGPAPPRFDPGRLRTAVVPPALEPFFLSAQQSVGEYFSQRVEVPDASTIAISGERYLMVRAASLSVEFVDLVRTLYREQGEAQAMSVAANLLYDVAHAIGKADARNFAERMHLVDPVERMSAGPVYFAFSGWAFVEIDVTSQLLAGDDFCLRYEHPFSFESDAWCSRGRQSDRPVCFMSAGYSSGWCEESFGQPLVAVEIECVAAGGSSCRFIMAPPARIEEHLARATGQPLGLTALEPLRGVTVPEFFQRKRMEDDLRRSRESLERRVEERTADLLAVNQALLREIEERRHVEATLRLLGTAVENAVEGMLVLDARPEIRAPRIVFANQGACRMTGRGRDELVGHGIDSLGVRGGEHELLIAALHEHLEAGQPYQGETTAWRHDGSSWTVELHVMPVEDSLGRPEHWVAILRDISERRARLAELEHRALHDPLTDLPNRLLLWDRLEQALLVAGRTRGCVALMFIDLDRFKVVNDRFGHACGDGLLRQVGPRMRAELRASDTIARLGGDEFAVVLPLVRGEDDALAAAEKIRRALAQPMVIEDRTLEVGASIGIALWPTHGDDAATLIRRADEAMYAAKRRGIGVHVFGAPTAGAVSRPEG